MLVIFLLVESPMLTNKVIRFFAQTTGEAEKASGMLAQVTRKIRAYLVARTLINLGLGLVIALGLWCLNVHFALILGLFAALTNFIPYIGQLIGGAVPTVIALGQTRLDRRCADRGGHVPGRRGDRGLRRDASGDGAVARPQRHHRADRLPFLGISLGTDGPGAGHADHREPEAGFSVGARAEPVGRADERGLAVAGPRRDRTGSSGSLDASAATPVRPRPPDRLSSPSPEAAPRARSRRPLDRPTTIRCDEKTTGTIGTDATGTEETAMEVSLEYCAL